MTEVIIRAFEMADWEDVAEIRLSPKSCWCTLQIPYQSRDEMKKKLENPLPGTYRLVAVVSSTQKVVGIIVLKVLNSRRAHVAELGLSVHDDYQNQGIGSQLMRSAIDFADKWLNLQRLELHVYTDNHSAIHLYEKYSFVIEGTLRKYAFRDGVYADAYAMARVL